MKGPKFLGRSSASKKREIRRKDKLRKQKEKELKTKQKTENKLRVKNWRLHVKMVDNLQNSDTGEFSSRQSEYRAVKKVKENLTRTPTKKAIILEKLIDSPRRILNAKGLTITPAAKNSQQPIKISWKSLRYIKIHRKTKQYKMGRTISS